MVDGSYTSNTTSLSVLSKLSYFNFTRSASESENFIPTISMFHITAEQQQYLTYRLTDTAQGNSLTVIPERGGIVTQWAVGGREILFLDTDRLKDPSLSVRGGVPILFPICGNLPDDAYQLGGKSYQLKQHGFARSMPWEVVSQSTDQETAGLTVALDSTPETKVSYPFDFHVELEYVLSEGQLQIIQRVTNKTADAVMPFAIGYHPYFNVIDKAALKFDIPSDRSYTKPGAEQPFDGTFDYSSGEIDLSFQNLAKPKTQVTSDHTLSIGWNYPGGHLVFWTLPDQDFYCLEPWTSGRNAMNTGKDMINLAAGETWTHTIALAIS
jgi:galactose mutarotase-like enzyme